MVRKKHARPLLVVAAVLAVTLLGCGLYWFQPWRLWTNVVVNEALPVVVDVAEPSTPATSSTISPSATGTNSAGRPEITPPTEKTQPLSVPSISDSSRPTTSAATSHAGSAASSAIAVRARLLADGELISHEHPTTGSVELIRLPDGHRALLLKDLRTSNGPALHVWLSDAPVLAGSQGWHVFDDGAHLDLGDLKGNIGNQIYPIGDEIELGRYSSVSIWCERFSVSFGAARLMPA